MVQLNNETKMTRRIVDTTYNFPNPMKKGVAHKNTTPQSFIPRLTKTNASFSLHASHRRPVVCLRSEASYASDQIV